MDFPNFKQLSRWIFCTCRRFLFEFAIFATWKSFQHGLINYIDTKAKCRNLKNWPVKGLRGRCLFVWGPPYTLYTYFILIHTGKRLRGWVRVEPKRRLEGQQFPKLGQKYQHMIEMYLQSINSDKHLPQSPFTGKFFLDDNLSLWFLYSYSVHGLRQSC